MVKGELYNECLFSTRIKLSFHHLNEEGVIIQTLI